MTLTLRVRPAEPPPPSPSQQQGEKEKAHVMGMERSATGDVTMRLNSTVLVQRSSYFEGLLDGAGTAMREGQGGSIVVELGDVQGA